MFHESKHLEVSKFQLWSYYKALKKSNWFDLILGIITINNIYSENCNKKLSRLLI
jgi:hypothetical protein